jgi:hypothetical protein
MTADVGRQSIYFHPSPSPTGFAAAGSPPGAGRNFLKPAEKPRHF